MRTRLSVLTIVLTLLFTAAPASADLWDIWQEMTVLTGPVIPGIWRGAGSQTVDFIQTVDDTVIGPLQGVTSLFGVGEVFTVSTNPNELIAKIQYSTVVRTGWTRDREAPGDYIVQFRAIRRP